MIGVVEVAEVVRHDVDIEVVELVVDPMVVELLVDSMVVELVVASIAIVGSRDRRDLPVRARL